MHVTTSLNYYHLTNHLTTTQVLFRPLSVLATIFYPWVSNPTSNLFLKCGPFSIGLVIGTLHCSSGPWARQSPSNLSYLLGPLISKSDRQLQYSAWFQGSFLGINCTLPRREVVQPGYKSQTVYSLGIEPFTEYSRQLWRLCWIRLGSTNFPLL